MRILILGAVACLLIAQCWATPIPDADKENSPKAPAEIQKEGEIQEQTTGVFKPEIKESAPKTEPQEAQKETEPAKPEAEEKPAEALKPEEKEPEKKVQAKPESQAPKKDRKGRQEEEEDEDDDDDDDDFLGLGDDDDDDDEEDEGGAADDDEDDEEEEEDYFERLFDDILGGGDDDDDEDDDDVSPSTSNDAPAKPAKPSKPSKPSKPAKPAAQIDEPAIDDNVVEGEEGEEAAEAVEDAATEEDGTLEAEASETDAIVEKDPSGTLDDVSNTVQEQDAPADETANDEDEDEDDDEEDDGLSAVIDDDDDDEDDEDAADDDDDEDDDDDDDDVTDIVDVIEARKARAMQNSIPKMPAIYISKYNRFVDTIVGRINRILGKSYDPVRVKLPASQSKTKKKTTTKRRTTTKTKNRTRTKTRVPLRPLAPAAMTNKMGDYDIARNKMEELPMASRTGVAKGRSIESEAREPAFILISRAGDGPVTTPEERERNATAATRAEPAPAAKAGHRVRASGKPKQKKKKTGTRTKNAKSAPKVRATLFGLSSLKRDGDVTVSMMADHTTVKSNFLLGPLTLRVEREIGKGAKRELKSATATTAEMFGRLNLRIIHGGAATLHSIRVLQPKQVRVDSADDHEKTKEFMWRRSAQIASVVSQKLSAAARSMLKPPPAGGRS